MPDAYNAAIAYNNLADLAVLTASSAIPLAPVTRLKGPHIARKWRTTGATGQYVVADLGSSQPVDTLGLFGLSLSTAAGTARVRASNTDATVTSALVYDSNALAAGVVDQRYQSLIHLISSPVSARYWRIDLADSGSYIEAGRLFIGVRNQFKYNYSPGWGRGWTDRSRTKESEAGQTYIGQRNLYRTVSLTFDAVTETERNSFVEEIDRICGIHQDVLLITRCDSPNLGRDSVWGLITDLEPVLQPNIVASDGDYLFQKTYRVRERA